MHIVIIHPASGKIQTARVFDTYKTSKELDEFLLNDITPGDIIVAACKDDCVTKLSELSNNWFTKELGSKLISKLEYR